MMKKVFIIIFALLLSIVAKASHIPGGNITYESIGGNDYVITMTLYEDCINLLIDSLPETIHIFNGCGFDTTEVVLPIIVFNQEVSQLCSSQLPFSNCNSGGTLPGIYMHIWQDTVELEGICSSWTFSYDLCCRNNADNSVGNDVFYIESKLNNTIINNNSSPIVTTQLLPYVCVSQPIIYNLGVYDPDGNTMLFSLVEAQKLPGGSITYDTGYSGIEPIQGITIDPLTGNLSFTPNQIGKYVVVVMIEEFDNYGNFLGSVIHDFEFVVINCPNNTTPVEPLGITNFNGAGILYSPNEIYSCPGSYLCFELEFTDFDAQDSIFISSNMDLVMPGATWTQVGWNSTAIIQVCWDIPDSIDQTVNVVFSAKDNACPIYGLTFFPVSIYLSKVDVGPDQTICRSDSALILATGGPSFNWITPFGGDSLEVGLNFSCDTCSFVYAYPDSTTTYVLECDTLLTCQRTDTLTITVVDDFSYTVSPMNEIFCIGDAIEFDVLSPVAGPFNYSWFPSDIFNDASISNPTFLVSEPFNDLISVIISSVDGCIKQDTIDIIIKPSYRPSIDLSFIDDTISCIDSVLLITSLNGTPPIYCERNLDALCGTDPLEYTVGTGSLSTIAYQGAIWGPFQNLFKSAKKQYLFTAQELNASGIGAGQITELSWYVDSIIGDSVVNSFNIRIGCTSSNQLSVWETGLFYVYTQNQTEFEVGKNTFPFAFGYNWDGVSNLVVEICQIQTQYGGNYDRIYSPIDSLSYKSMLIYRTGVGACSFTGNAQSQFYRPKTTFTNCIAPANNSNYSFEWSPSSTIIDSNSDSTYAFPLSDMGFQVLVTDTMSGCSDSASLSIVVECCKTPSVLLDSITCYNGSNGSIAVSPLSDAPGPYVVELLNMGTVIQYDSSVLNSNVFNNLSAGTYTIVCIDQNGCQSDTIVTLYNPTPIIVSAGSDSSVCIGDSIQLSATGGNSFIWNSNPNISSVNIADPIYTASVDEFLVVVVTDSNGCFNQDSIHIIALELPQADAGVDLWGCPGFSVQLSGSGGDFYQWSPASLLNNPNIITPIATPIDTTIFYVEVTDALGCKSMDSMVVFANGAVSSDAGQDKIICFGDSIVIGGTPTSDQATSYIWTPSIFVIDNTIANPTVFPNSDTWFYVESSSDTCSGIDSVFVIVNLLPNVNAGDDAQICSGDSMQLEASGGLDYYWLSGSNMSSDSISTPIVWPTDTTEYVVVATDINGCVQYDSVIIIVNPSPLLISTPDTSVCRGDSIQIISYNGSDFNWEPSNITMDPNVFNPIVFPDTSTMFHVLVIDSNSCSNVDSVMISVFRIETSLDTTICELDSITLSVIGNGTATYLWQPSAFVSADSLSDPVAFPDDNQIFTVVGTDMQGCTDQSSFQINLNPLPVAEFDYSILVNCDNVEIIAEYDPLVEQSYFWQDKFNEQSTENPITFSADYGEDYYFTLNVSSQFGCNSFLDTIVAVEDFTNYLEFIVPNVFTPNEDDENDLFWMDIPASVIDCMEFSIFNRWGQELFKSFGNNLAWDGKTTDGIDVPEGVYFYVLKIKNQQHQGTINIFR